MVLKLFNIFEQACFRNECSLFYSPNETVTFSSVSKNSITVAGPYSSSALKNNTNTYHGTCACSLANIHISMCIRTV